MLAHTCVTDINKFLNRFLKSRKNLKWGTLVIKDNSCAIQPGELKVYYLIDCFSTKTHHSYASHHSKSNWSFGWDDGQSKTKAKLPSKTVDQRVTQDKQEPTPVKPKASSPILPAKSGNTSANSYANGDNQNCGNFISDRPTT